MFFNLINAQTIRESENKRSTKIVFFNSFLELLEILLSSKIMKVNDIKMHQDFKKWNKEASRTQETIRVKPSSEFVFRI